MRRKFNHFFMSFVFSESTNHHAADNVNESRTSPDDSAEAVAPGRPAGGQKNPAEPAHGDLGGSSALPAEPSAAAAPAPPPAPLPVPPLAPLPVPPLTPLPVPSIVALPFPLLVPLPAEAQINIKPLTFTRFSRTWRPPECLFVYWNHCTFRPAGGAVAPAASTLPGRLMNQKQSG